MDYVIFSRHRGFRAIAEGSRLGHVDWTAEASEALRYEALEAAEQGLQLLTEPGRAYVTDFSSWLAMRGQHLNWLAQRFPSRA